MRFRTALLLDDLGHRLVAPTLLREGPIEQGAFPSGLGKGQPVALVHVVRDGQRLNAVAPQPVKPVPQVLGVWGVLRAERQRRHLGALENDIAMQVAAEAGGVFVSNQRRELARSIVSFGGGNDAPPSLAHHRLHAVGLEQPPQGPANGSRQRVAGGALVSGLLHRQDRAQELRMVGDGQKVERRAGQLQPPSARMGYGFSLGEPIGVVRRGAQVFHHECVQGVHRVDMQIAKVGGTLRGRRLAAAGGADQQQRRCDAAQPSISAPDPLAAAAAGLTAHESRP